MMYAIPLFVLPFSLRVTNGRLWIFFSPFFHCIRSKKRGLEITTFTCRSLFLSSLFRYMFTNKEKTTTFSSWLES